MKTKYFAVLILAFSMNACQQSTEKNKAMDNNKSFNAFKNRFIDNLWAVFPSWASGAGNHKYDSILTVPDEAERNKELAFAKANLDSLKVYKVDSLDANNKTDYKIIENQLNST